MKVNISQDEWYPVYSIEEYDAIFPEIVVDIPKELFDEINLVFDRFNEVQDQLRKLYNGDVI